MAVWWEGSAQGQPSSGELRAYRSALLDGEGFTRPTAYGVGSSARGPAPAHFTTSLEGFVLAPLGSHGTSVRAWKGLRGTEYIEAGGAT